MSNDLKIGLIGLDTSHAPAFCKLLSNSDDPNYVKAGKVVAAFPGGSPDFEKSISRVEGFTKQIKEDFGVEMLDSPEAVAEAVDVVLITAVDGRAHLGLFEKIAPLAKPTFIDKPFSASIADAEKMIALAETHNVPLMAGSSLRYSQDVQNALKDDSLGAIVGVDVFGPMALDETLPGLFWYGCHSVEMMVAAMGAGVANIRSSTTDYADLLAVQWKDGRQANIRGNRKCAGKFGMVIHRENGFQFVDAQASGVPYYAGLLQAIFKTLPHGKSDIPAAEMLEIVRVMELGNQSRYQNGAVINFD